MQFKPNKSCQGYDRNRKEVCFFETGLKTFQLTADEMKSGDTTEIGNKIDRTSDSLFKNYKGDTVPISDIVYIENLGDPNYSILNNKFVAVGESINSNYVNHRVFEFTDIDDLTESNLMPGRKCNITANLSQTFKPQAVAGMVVE